MATGFEKYVQRVGHTTGHMSKALAKPNVCRIEVLDGAARRAYIGGLHKSVDVFREQIYEAIANDSDYNIYEPFYGILNMKDGNGPSIDVKSVWRMPDGNKSGFARMNTLLTGSTGGNRGLIGAIPLVGSTLSSGVNSVLGGIESVAQMGMELSGVNNSTTGSMTIKKFGGSTISASFPLEFQWYLPVQEDMCRKSLQRLIMMAYVRPMVMEGYDIVNQMISGMLNAGSQMIDSAKEMVQQVAKPYTGSLFKEGSASTARDTPQGSSELRKTIARVVGTGVDVYNSINTFFGGEITANPLPVRVSIGHYLDLEPMVIDSVAFSSSNEQFISSDGTHLPVFVNAKVTVSYWMQPGPTKDFISILGNEVFGKFVNNNNTPSAKNKADGKIKRGNNPNIGKKR